jgi:RNA polymerase sigma factor (sigma-70 family)
MISGSVEHYRIETTKRLGVLYNKHHSWLMACAYNKSKDIKVSEDLVQDLFLYLGEKNNPKIYYRDSFNLLYCHQFLSSRYINYIKRQNKLSYIDDKVDGEDKQYDTEFDLLLENSYDQIKKELETLSKTKMWSSSKLFELYAFSDMTMDELSKKIGISKSTVFLNIKKIKKHLNQTIDNPFKDEREN